jgi:hypothetical protein
MDWKKRVVNTCHLFALSRQDSNSCLCVPVVNPGANSVLARTVSRLCR